MACHQVFLLSCESDFTSCCELQDCADLSNYEIDSPIEYGILIIYLNVNHKKFTTYNTNSKN